MVVVDSGSTPLTARRVIAALKKLTAKPVRVLVNTHWHYDHVFGNQEYAAAFPGVEIVSHPLARQDMLERSGARREPAAGQGRHHGGGPEERPRCSRGTPLRERAAEVPGLRWSGRRRWPGSS